MVLQVKLPYIKRINSNISDSEQVKRIYFLSNGLAHLYFSDYSDYTVEIKVGSHLYPMQLSYNANLDKKLKLPGSLILMDIPIDTENLEAPDIDSFYKLEDINADESLMNEGLSKGFRQTFIKYGVHPVSGFPSLLLRKVTHNA